MPVQLASRFRQPIVHPKPFFPAEHQSPFPEIRQVAGDGGLRQVQSLMEMANTYFTVSQQIQKPQPHWIGEGFEKFD